MHDSGSPTDTSYNVSALLDRVAQATPDKPAIVLPERMKIPAITFAQLWQQAGRVAGSLQAHGLKPGDRVIVMIPMSIDLYVALLAIIRLGAVAVFIDPWMRPSQIAAFAEYANPTGFIGVARSHLLRWLKPHLRSLPITVSTGTRFAGWLAKDTLARLKQGPDTADVYPVRPTDSALITFTSGSSGEPKGANRTHQFLRAQHQALAEQFPYRPDDIDLPSFPVFALNNLVWGITTIVPDMDFRNVAGVDGMTIGQQIRQHQVTTCTASPPLLDRLAQTPDSRDLSLRRILTGGAPISDRQIEHWQTAFPQAEIVIAYGSTEAEPVAHIDSHQRLQLPRPRQGFCMGHPIDSIETAILPIQTNTIDRLNWEQQTLPSGQIGELWVHGDHVCQNYYQNETATRVNKWSDQSGRVWHRMGDTGYFDTTGRFWLVGRVHSTIELPNQQVHPQLVEQAITDNFPSVVQAAAVGVPSSPAADGAVQELGVIVVADDPNITAKRISTFLKQQGYPVGRCQVQSNRLPVDPRHNSKIDYDAARQSLQSESSVERVTASGTNGQLPSQEIDPTETQQPDRGKDTLSPTSPFLRRLTAYSRERFPVLKHGILIACFYSSNHFLAQALIAPDQPLTYDVGSILGVLTLFLFFFHLRVFDEHKDFREDSRHYPDRILQRGIITLRELRWLAAGAILAQIVMAALWQPSTMSPPQVVSGALMAVLAAIGFSVLMLKEFFVPAFLKRHFLLYAISHLLVMPLLSMIVFGFTTGEYFWTAPGLYWLYACVGFFVTFNWEISRKINAPEQEIAGVDSYTQRLGRYGAAWWVLVMRVIDTLLVMIVGWYLSASLWFYLALIGLFVGCLFGFVSYMRRQTPRTAGQMETWAGLYIIAFDLILAVELIARYGLQIQGWPT